MYSKERGFSQFLVVVVMLIVATLAVVVNQNLMNLAINEANINDSTTLTIANQFDVTETTKVALGDKIYEITPNAKLEDEVFPIIEYLEFNKDFNVVTVTLNTKYNNINYCVLNGNKILDYRIDPKTRFVGFTMGSVDTTNPAMKSVTVNDYNYPNTSHLVPYTAEYSRNRLSFNVLNGVYALKYPQTYITSNTSTELSNYTTLAIALPKQFTDIIFFETDLTHNAPIVLQDSASEILSHLKEYPYIKINYNEEDKYIGLSTNYASIDSPTMNEKLTNTGVTVDISMHNADAYDITSGQSRLNYPTQHKFKFQDNDVLELSNWNMSSKEYEIDFVGCVPQKITLTRNGYYYTITTDKSVRKLN